MAKAAAGSAQAADKPVKTGKPGRTAPADKPNVFARIGTYFRDVRSEMKRVEWPTRAEVLNSSVVVVTTLIFFIVFILIVDQVVIQFLKLIGKLG